jgi:Fungal specific transcription factor domain
MLFGQNSFESCSKGLQNAVRWLEMLTSLVADYDGLTFSIPASGDTSFTSKDDRTGLPFLQTSTPVDPILGTWSAILPSIGQLARVIHCLRTSGPTSILRMHVRSIEDNLLGWDSDTILEKELPGATRNPDHVSMDIMDPLLLSPSPSLWTANDVAFSEKDILTLTHCHAMAHAYRLAGLVTLYQYFPLLLKRRTTVTSDCQSSEFIQQLADFIITLLRDIPAGSRIFNVCSFPLMAAGQFCNTSEQREWVLSVFADLRVRNGISAVTKLGNTLEEVWRRRDEGVQVSWLDVFDEWDCRMLIN